MLRTITLTGAVLLAATFAAGPAAAAEPSGYTIADLLEPCMEGDNDSRWGQVAEMECEQYVRGFTDALVLVGADERGVCLPAQNRDDEVRWAFMRWAHKHFERRHEPAASGLMEALETSFACSN